MTVRDLVEILSKPENLGKDICVSDASGIEFEINNVDDFSSVVYLKTEADVDVLLA